MPPLPPPQLLLLWAGGGVEGGRVGCTVYGCSLLWYAATYTYCIYLHVLLVLALCWFLPKADDILNYIILR